MQNLTRARDELYRRKSDERFGSLLELWQHCRTEKDCSLERWHPPIELLSQPTDGKVALALPGDGAFGMNEWSFSQLCQLARVSKDTLNRLSAETASRVFAETLPNGRKPLQLLTTGDRIRAIHRASYTRLYNADLLTVVREFATDFQPPQASDGGGTGLYCGEQDMFCFLIDPTGWVEIKGEAFAPGFFIWNSEVGRRSVGIQTFWFQSVCQNHIVWDAIDVASFSRKHTANVYDSLRDIRRRIERLVNKPDERREGFVNVIRNAMATNLGDTDGVLKMLSRRGFGSNLANEALEVARQTGGLTIFAVVDALTRLARRQKNAGDRFESDTKASRLLALAADA